MLRFTSAHTPLGDIAIIATERGIVATALSDGDREQEMERFERTDGMAARRDDRGMGAARRELGEYFAGTLSTFATPVDLSFAGDGFYAEVYEATMRVPYGELRTYGDVAAMAGRPRAWRAAGHALRICPIELWIPCHRVVPAGPGFGTYAGHPERREFLLRLEGAT